MEGQIKRYKARLVAQGFSQIPRVDFNETFAPVTRHQMLQTLLALANRHDWHVHQMDVKSAFLNGDLDNEIFMKIPPGAEGKHGEVWLLHKALYGLKQASREWYLKLKSQLEGLGFKRSNVDHGVFTKNVKGRLLVITVYVDDFLLFLSSIENIKTVKSDLKMCFDMKDLDEAKWILQMKIERSRRDTGSSKLSISQEQYVETILERHGMSNCNPARTPMASNTHLPVLSEAEIDIIECQRCIGSLMYLMVCTRPDIAYSVGVLSCHVAAPGHAHMQAVKQIFHYLHGTSEYKLEFHTKNSNKTSPIAYVDSDWAGDRSDRKSISGYTVMIDGGAISWGSKKQTSVSLLTVKVEFIAALTAVKEALWHRSFLVSLDMKLTDPT